MTKFPPIAVFISLSVALSAQSKPLELTSEPGHHLVLKNQYTRVFQVTVPPHATTQLHLHRHSYLFVNLGQAEIENDVQGKAPVKMKLADGQTELSPGPFAHVIKNVDETPFRNVTIEILRSSSSAAEGAPRARGLSVDGVRVIHQRRMKNGGAIDHGPDQHNRHQKELVSANRRIGLKQAG